MRQVILIIFLCWAIEVKSHSDTVIVMENTGALTGLSSAYEPAFIQWKNRKIVVGSNTYIFPECTMEFFSRLGSNDDLVMYASWYHHNKNLLPNYLAIVLESDRLGFMIDLDELKPFSIKKKQYKKEDIKRYYHLSDEEICEAYKGET